MRLADTRGTEQYDVLGALSTARAAQCYRAIGAGSARSTGPQQTHGCPPLAHCEPRLADEPPPRTLAASVTIFPSSSFSAALSSIACRQQPFQLSVSRLQRSQALRLANLEPSVLALPGVNVASLMPCLRHSSATVSRLLLQGPDDLLLRVPRRLHLSVAVRSGLYLLMADLSGSTSCGSM